MTISEFIAARLDEARQRAEAMGHLTVGGPGEADFFNCPATRTGPLGDLPWGEDACDCGLAERKARALRKVEASRRLIRRYKLAVAAGTSVVSYVRGVDDGYKEACLDAIEDVAAIDSDHPDYDESWKP